MFRRLSLFGIIVALAGLALAGCQQGQSYPSKPVEYVVAASTGGGSDTWARTIADMMAKEKIVTQTITIVNKPGGGGATGNAYVAEKAGDSHVLYNTSTTHISMPLTGGTKITMKDFTPVAILAFDVNVVAVKADSPYKSIKDLVDASKAGQKISHGGGTVASTENMSRHLMNKVFGSDIEYVSFNSKGEAMTAVLGGHVQYSMPAAKDAIEHARAGTIRVIGIASEKRLDSFPGVPTLKEQGVPDVPETIRGVVMPKGVPQDAVKYWQAAFQKLRATDKYQTYLKENELADAWRTGADQDALLETATKAFETLFAEMGMLKK